MGRGADGGKTAAAAPSANNGGVGGIVNQLKHTGEHQRDREKIDGPVEILSGRVVKKMLVGWLFHFVSPSEETGYTGSGMASFD